MSEEKKWKIKRESIVNKLINKRNGTYHIFDSVETTQYLVSFLVRDGSVSIILLKDEFTQEQLDKMKNIEEKNSP